MTEDFDITTDEMRQRAKQIVDEHLARNAGHREDAELVAAHPSLSDLIEQYLRTARLLDGVKTGDRDLEPTVKFDATASASEHLMSTVRCPECHTAMDASASDSTTCSSCGSSVEVVRPLPNGRFQANALLGRFELIEEVGSGGFGIVWKARDLQLDRLVAIKIPRQVLDASEVEQFFREARTASKVRHKNIVAVHEVGRDGDTIFMVSDFIDGDPLSKRLKSSPYPSLEAAKLIETVCIALQAIHDEGITHRDLKLDNVLLNKKNLPFLTDFGLAKRTDGLTMTQDGLVMGTPAYMSPEQARGDANKADARSDIYAVGVMLFELLTQERPFRGSPIRIIEQVLNDEPPRVRSLQPSAFSIGRLGNHLPSMS